MLSTLRRMLIATLALGAAYAIYALVAAPVIEPPIRRQADSASASTPISDGVPGEPVLPVTPSDHRLVAALFPEDSWQRRDCKMIETSQGLFLYQEFKPLPDRRLEMKPCSVILASAADLGAAPPDSGASSSPPIVMTAIEGAILQFDEESDPARLQFGKVIGGNLPGAIVIERPESAPGARDNLKITTQNIQINEQQIWTAHEVEFHYGPSWGRGRDLTIALQPRAAKATDGDVTKAALGGIKFIELVHVEKVHIELPPAPSPADSDAATRDTNTKAGDAKAARSNAPAGGLFDASTAAPVEITCRGPFRLDLLDRLAAFEDQVEVLRLAANGPSDSLSCQLLRVHFLMRARAAAAAAGAATSTSGSSESTSGGVFGSSSVSNLNGSGSGSSSFGPGGSTGGLGGSSSSNNSSGSGTSGGSGASSGIGGAGSPGGAATGASNSSTDKTSANSSTNALRKFEVERLVATGHPVVLRAPSTGAAARGERLEYNVRTRLLHLEDSQKASLTRDNQELQSPHIQYELPVDTRRLGRAWAAGPGSMTRTNPATGAIAVSARWGQELLLRPHQDRHVLSISGGTSIQLGALGQFAADELHVWILEATDDKKVSIEFDRLLAQGNVNFGSPRMDGKTQRLEAWFRREPAELTAPGTGPGSTASYSSRLPGVPVSGAAGGALDGAFTSAPAGGAGGNRSPVNKLEVRGDLVRVQASLIGDGARLDEISVRGRVEVNEQTPAGTTPAPGADPLKIVGDSLEVHDAQSEQSVLQVVGRPARVSARGMVLQGDSVNLDQNEGRMWIEGVGQMTLPALTLRSKPKGEVLFQNNTPLAPAAPLGNRADELDPQARQETTTKPTPVIVSWKGGMEFDGLNAKFQRDVQIRGAHRLSTGEVYDLMAVGGQLDITLTRRVRFDGPSPTDDVEMQNVRFSGHVYAEGRTTHAGGMVSQEKLQIRNLSLDHSTGRIQGDGPGWVESVRLDQTPSGSPLGGRAPAGPGPHLAFLHIDFARGIQGHLPTNTIEALDDVRAVYGPVSAWDQTIDSQQPDLLGDSSIVLTCQRVAISQPPSAPTVAGQPAIELEATGNALVEGRRFAARAARISFSQAKDLLIFAGDGRTDAEFWKKPRGGKLKPDAIARTIFYNRQTGDVEIDKGKYFDLAPFTDGLQQQQQQRRPPGR